MAASPCGHCDLKFFLWKNCGFVHRTALNYTRSANGFGEFKMNLVSEYGKICPLMAFRAVETEQTVRPTEVKHPYHTECFGKMSMLARMFLSSPYGPKKPEVECWKTPKVNSLDNSSKSRYVFTPMSSGLRWPGQTNHGSWPPAFLISNKLKTVCHSGVHTHRSEKDWKFFTPWSERGSYATKGGPLNTSFSSRSMHRETQVSKTTKAGILNQANGNTLILYTWSQEAKHVEQLMLKTNVLLKRGVSSAQVGIFLW